MTDKEYRQKRRECWEDFKRENFDGEEQLQTVNPYYVFREAFDRAYALGKQEKDAEEEEMLTVPRKKVKEKWQRAYEQETKYSRAQDSPVARLELYYNRGRMSILDALFGSKCLPDESNLSESLTGSEPKPAEPTNEGTRQEQCVPKSAESGTRSINRILKDGFRDHNRLHIAAMMAQGLLSNGNGFYIDDKNVDKTPQNIAEAAFIFADALIAESEKEHNHGEN